MQANQNNVIWAVVIAAVVLLVVSLFIAGSINSNLKLVGEKLDGIDIDETALANAIVAGIVIPEAPSSDTEKVDRICELTEGCDGQWDLNNFMRGLFENVVLEELTERYNKALFNEIKDLVDVEEREDIDTVSVKYQTLNRNPMTVNQEDYDSLYDANDDTVVTGEFVIEVEYFDDDDNEDRTRWFKVTATVSDVEDGIAEGDVVINSVEKVSKHFEFD